jgi:hypothetical protein
MMAVVFTAGAIMLARLFIEALIPEKARVYVYASVFVISLVMFYGLLSDMEVRSTYTLEPHIEDTAIYSLHDSQSTRGTFSIGRGVFEGYSQYLYYRGVPGGGLKQEHIRADDVIIYQDEDDNPYIRVISTYRNYTYTGEYERYYMSPQYYQIHVPNGTVIHDYRLDG